MKHVFKKATSVALLSALVSGLASCGSNDLSTSVNGEDQISALSKRDAQGDAQGKKKWTVLVHLAADNNLYQFGLKDMSEMAYGLTNTNDVNVVVLFDGEKNGDSAIYEITHSDKKPAMSAPITSKKISTPVFSGNEVDSGDPKLFAKFVDWGTKTYPADHTAVIIWNHGNGLFREGKNFKPKKSKALTPGGISTYGFAWDDNGGNMNMKDLNPAFAPVVANLGKKIDILDFDACLMAHVESAYQIKDHVNYLVASEKTEAGDGNDYWGILEAASKNPNMSGTDFAKMMVDSYAKSYVPGGHQYTGRPEEYTLSATDTAAVANGLAPAINDLGTALSQNPSLAKASRTNTTVYENADSADLGHFLKLMAKDSKAAPVKAQIDRASSELNKAVIREVHTGKAANDLEDSTGLVLYFPTPGDGVNSKYTNPAEIKFAENTGWINFLKAFVKSSR